MAAASTWPHLPHVQAPPASLGGAWPLPLPAAATSFSPLRPSVGRQSAARVVTRYEPPPSQLPLPLPPPPPQLPLPGVSAPLPPLPPPTRPTPPPMAIH